MVPRYRALLVMILGCLVLSPATRASSGFFSPTAGPDGRYVLDVASAPNGDVYAARGSDVYVLRSGVNEWALLPALPGDASSIEAAPDGTIWAFGWVPLGASTTPFVSVDGGGHWQTAAPVPRLSLLEFDSAGRALAGTDLGLFRSADDGASWSPVELPAQHVDAIAIDGDVIWVAIGTTLHRSDDVGASWVPAATLPLPAVAMAPHPDGGVYACLVTLVAHPECDPSGVYRVTAAGDVSLLGLDAVRISSIRVQDDGTVLVSARDCEYYDDCIGVIYRSTDAGVSWTSTSTQFGGPQKIVERSDGALFTATRELLCSSCFHVQPGVLVSLDGGASWTAKNDRLGRERINWVATPPGSNIVYAANNTSAYASTDGGTTWTLLADMSPVTCAQWYGTTAFTAMSQAPAAFAFQYQVGIHRVMPGNAGLIPWVADVWDMVSMPSGALVIAAGRIYVAPFPIALPNVNGPFGPSGIQHLAVGTGNRVAGATSTSTHLSNDGGQTWTNIAAVGGMPAFSTDGLTLYVAQAQAQSVSLWRMRESTNWMVPELMPTLPIASNSIHDILVDAAGAVYILDRTARIMRLSYGATSWIELDVVPNASQLSLASDGYLYVASDGVWRSASPVGTITDAGLPDGVIDAVATVPNPVSDQASIRFRLGRSGPVELAVYDVRGRLVSTLLSQAVLQPGAHDVTWRLPARTPNGLYMYRLRVAGVERSGRMLVLRR